MTRVVVVAPWPPPALSPMLKGVVFVQRTVILDDEFCATAWLGSYEEKVSELAESMMQIALTVLETLKFVFVVAAWDNMAADSIAVATAAFIANRRLLFIVRSPLQYVLLLVFYRVT